MLPELEDPLLVVRNMKPGKLPAPVLIVTFPVFSAKSPVVIIIPPEALEPLPVPSLNSPEQSTSESPVKTSTLPVMAPVAETNLSIPGGPIGDLPVDKNTLPPLTSVSSVSPPMMVTLAADEPVEEVSIAIMPARDQLASPVRSSSLPGILPPPVAIVTFPELPSPVANVMCPERPLLPPPVVTRTDPERETSTVPVLISILPVAVEELPDKRPISPLSNCAIPVVNKTRPDSAT
eukprot:snap_masked-scaffold_29-processed-gene-4.36-mRNA-1 protein AED:1.00 eAED:1.00 QI:0/-1/0/0/-1/1/1/0/234